MPARVTMTRKIWAVVVVVVVVATAFVTVVLLFAKSVEAFSVRKGSDPPPPMLMLHQQHPRGSSSLEPSAWTHAAYSCSPSSCRRDFLGILVTATSMMILLPPPTRMTASAFVGEGSERMVFRQAPSAPVGALLPAVQQRLLLEAVRGLAAKDVEAGAGKGGDDDKRQKTIESILLPLNTNRLSSSSKNNQDAKLLKQYSPSQVLSGSLVRASMNLYTANLNYGAIINNAKKNPADVVYEVTDPSWKRAYIRANDGLPSVDKVVAADLDVRDLLRNQVQLQLDDASAEWYNSNNDCDMPEFRALLQEAAASFDLWLDKIAEKDVQEALQVALEGKELQFYQPYAAGFLPPTASVTTTS